MMKPVISCLIMQTPLIIFSLCLCSSTALPCNWITDTRQKLDPYISGDPKIVPLDEGEGLAECQRRCVEESTFICAAVNYRQSNRRCELLEENDQTAEPKTDTNYQYSLRPICAGSWQPWTAVKGRYLNTGVYKISETNTDNLRSCMSRCVGYVRGTDCRSILKDTSNSNKRCELVNKRSDDDNVQNEQSDEWQYFDRPHWYLDEAPGATGLTVSQRGDRGTDYVIMYNNPIEADGYLVAWQYFTRSSGTPCQTCAAVWEQSGTSRNFKLIDYTLLNDVQGLGTVNFHFVTNKFVKVKQGDSPSIFVKDNSNCSGFLVTYAIGGSIDTYYGSYQDVQNIEVNEILTVRTDRVYKVGRAVSIRPFVAEYLVVSGISADISNMADNSVQLSWGDPIGYQSRKAGTQDITGGGFKITCSTSSDFSSEIECSSSQSICPDTERSDVLSLPDFTRPYYARIQVVRNFNGKETVDEKYTDSQQFCARRPMLTDSQISIDESGVLRPWELRSVSLQTSALGDSCVISIEITCGSGILENQPKSGVWNFTKDQGTTFLITVSANLVGGYQQQVWSKSYATMEVPSAPDGLKSVDRRIDSATLEWHLIEDYHDVIITNYQVDCTVSNNTFNMDADPGSSEALTFTTNTPEMSHLQITGLLPQVRYECQVKALLKDEGYGISSESVFLWTEPDYPALIIPSTNGEDLVNDGSVTITLPNVTTMDKFDQRFSKIWIVVERVPWSRLKRSTTTTTALTIDGLNTYITAKIALHDASSTFIVGDGLIYGGANNKELENGDYTIYVGYQAVTEVEVTEFYQINQELLRVVVPNTPQSTLPITQETAAKNTAIISGIVGCVVGVFVTTATMLAVRFLRRRNGWCERRKNVAGDRPQQTGSALPDIHIYDTPGPDPHDENTYQLVDRSLPDSHVYASTVVNQPDDKSYQNVVPAVPDN